MSEMVDRICDLLMEHGCGNSEQCEKTARAAITAMREPTGEMIEVGARYGRTGPGYTLMSWRDMIDVALRDQ